MKRGKKAISDVIVLVLIILISIAAIFIVWTFIKPQFQEGSAEISQKGVELSSVELKINKLNLEDNSLKISVQNNGEKEIFGFTVKIYSQQVIYFNDSVSLVNNRSLSSLEEGIILITPAPFGSNPNNYTKLEIFPKFSSDGTVATSAIPSTSKTFISNTSQETNLPQNTYYKDSDQDGYSDGTEVESSTPVAGYNLSSELTSTLGDCDDTDSTIHNNATEICDHKDNNCNNQIDENLICPTFSKPFNTPTTIYTNFSNWTNYSGLFESKQNQFFMSPIIDAGSNNEMQHHWITVNYSGTGKVKVSIGHYSGTGLTPMMNLSYQHTTLTTITSGVELYTKSQYRKERYAWVILNITGNVTLNSITHTRSLGINTAYGHEPATFNFANGTLRYRLLYPKNYNSTSGKKYPLIISCPGSGGIGNDNLVQMEMVGIGRYLFEQYYNYPEFESFSIVVQPDSYSRNPYPYYSNGTVGKPGTYQDGWVSYTQENGYYVTATKALVNQMINNYTLNIDPNRIYFSGFSLGGMATYEFMKAMNDTLAAAWSVAGWPIGYAYSDYTTRNQTDPMIVQLKSEVQRYKQIPLQIGSGGNDGMKYGGNLSCREINAAGGTCIHYIFPGVDHTGSAGQAFGNINQMRWLFNQTKSY